MEIPQKAIKFSIIIPAYNSANSTAFCLQALFQQSIPLSEYEIIVVDDGSTDNTAEVIKKFKVRYLHQSNQGPATARNLGAKEAKGEIILFTDSDCVPEYNWIEEMVKPFSNFEIAAVKGAYKTKQKEWIARFCQAEFEDRYDLLLKSRYIDMIDTYSAAFRKEIFHNMGGFDQSFPVANNEDTDLSYRLSSAGYKLVFNPNALVYHTHPHTLRKYLRIKFWRGYWRLIVYKRYPNKAVKDSYTPSVIKIQTILMALSLPLLIFSFVIPYVLPFFILSLIFILLSTIPFAHKTYQKDKTIGLLSPIIIILRSVVFAAGSLLGSIYIKRHKGTKDGRL